MSTRVGFSGPTAPGALFNPTPQLPSPTRGPPTKEIGVATPQILPWGVFVDYDEEVSELMWPFSVRTYHAMRNDSQVAGLLLGMTSPIRRYSWLIDPNGAKAKIYQAVADDLGLDVVNKKPKPRGRVRGRFSHDTHLYHAMLALTYGHMFFEQVGEIDSNGLWRLRKLAPRMPPTIMQIITNQQGDLISIKQWMGMFSPEITADRLAPFVWNREAGQWVGRSMLRSMYKNWLIKDRLIRVDAIKHERNGLGVPTITAPDGASPAQLQALDALAQAYKAGESAGGALPAGAVLKLNGVNGLLPDTIASIRYHDEQMAHSGLMMFMQLGTTLHGSRALGGSFIDFFGLSQQALALWYADTMNEYVIEDWVDWNYGPDEQAPLLVYERNEANQELATSDLVALIEAGAIHVDPDLEAWLRDENGMPPLTTTPEPAAPPSPNGAPLTPLDQLPKATKSEHQRERPRRLHPDSPAAQRRSAERRAGAARRNGRRPVVTADALTPAAVDVSAVSLPDRPLRRQPYTVEAEAAVDFKQLDQQWNSLRDQLMADWTRVTTSQIAELHALIAQTANLDELSSVQATAVGADILAKHMKTMAEEGMRQHLAEAARQGVQIPEPDMQSLHGALESRATAVDQLLARSLSEAAGRKAVSLTGGSLSLRQVADQTKTYLTSLSDKYLQDQLGGTLTQAMNSGRREAMREADQPARFYASELLDDNTCEFCTDEDGQEFLSLDEAEADYPTGGFKDCAGGLRCRGTLVAVYEEAAPSGE